MRERVASYFRELQDRICTGLEQLDGRARFRHDDWTRPGGGGGQARVIEDGELFEKAGVNFSEVHGELAPDFARTLPGSGPRFHATGISLVLHPRSPMVPTVHANLRHLEHGEASWFGGGSDLTPYYFYPEDAQHFHRVWKAVCDRYAADSYARFKAQCDRYFFLPHRGESRGVGGIFFDYLQDDPEATFAFVRGCGDGFLDAYVPIAERRRGEPWGEREREWQLHRRGRYVEFNLLYDRGTVFGLKTFGRVESILMSLPPRVRWGYEVRAEPGSREAELLAALEKPRDWV
ncbi:MAG TPA: oxygen-dependent coproporphyrinogen oxidase [Polyangia bacterium]|nr:oxygen-dependent coproporphyrinogen oxidase [Polyangia bacterium]